MLLTKESELSMVLSLVKLMHCLNTILCIFHWHTEQKDLLSIKIFINVFFTTWQAIPFKRKFYYGFPYRAGVYHPYVSRCSIHEKLRGKHGLGARDLFCNNQIVPVHTLVATTQCQSTVFGTAAS